jgi:hypothetical protein
MFCPSLRSKIVHPRDVPTNLTCVETFPGAACLKSDHARVEANIAGRLLRARAAPLQGLGTINSRLEPSELSPALIKKNSTGLSKTDFLVRRLFEVHEEN